jgi:hypothetical protein
VFAWKTFDADAMRGGDQNSEEAQSMDNEEAAAIRSLRTRCVPASRRLNVVKRWDGV